MLMASVFNLGIVASVIVIHYEALRAISRLLTRIRLPGRLPVLLCVPAVLTAHVLEIWVFGAAFYVQIYGFELGSLVGTPGSLLDCVYFSFVTYTSLGIGDVYPTGHIRYHAGLEALVGLVLIGWTASFLYVEMERYWNRGP